MHLPLRRDLHLVLAVLVPALLIPLFALAHTDEPVADVQAVAASDAELNVAGNPDPALPIGAVNCFDYYRFGSVQVPLAADVSSTVSGATITFSGTIRNENPYPIVDGALYVKVFRVRGEGDAYGPDVVDQFFVKSDISLPAQGSEPVTFAWRVPALAESGEYQLATFFSVDRKFNLNGLSFTDDVVGNTVPFVVVGESAGSVMFDKTAVTVDGNPYFFAAYPPRVHAQGPVPVVATVSNTTDQPASAVVSWDIYQWDALLRQNLLEQYQSSVSVPAHGSAPVTVSIDDDSYPVYLAVGTLDWNGTKSIVNVRFVREGIDRPRINFPSVVSYPLKANEPATVFSCVHNSGASSIVSGTKLELTLSDMRGNPIHTYTYDGDVTSAMMGVADTFVPTADYDHFMLDARLYGASGLIDEAHMEYGCAASNDPACTDAAPDLAANISDMLTGLLGSASGSVLLYGMVIAGILFLFVIRSLVRNL